MSQVDDALRAIRAKLVAIGKVHEHKDKNGHVMYTYRSADDVMEACKPLFTEHEVMVYPSTSLVRSDALTTSSGGLVYRSIVEGYWRFKAKDDSVEAAQTLGEGIDYSDKGIGKAQTNSEKYAYCQVLQITAADVRRNVEEDAVGEEGEITGNGATPIESPPANIDKSNRAVTPVEYEELVTYASQYGFDRAEVYNWVLDRFGIEPTKFKKQFTLDILCEAKVKMYKEHDAKAVKV
jgi:hypothetical protein